MPSRIAQDGSSTDLAQSGATLTAGSVVVRFDDLGRTVSRGDLSLSYGPDGQVAAAQRGSTTWSFVYDEKGERRAKLSGGAPVSVYLDGGYLDPSGLAEVVRVGGRVVGIVRNGAYETVPVDLRSSVVGERDGTARVPSPFGQRDAHPLVASILEYVEKGSDTDLGFIRMGVRDYDPALARFLTPDPLVLDDPALCLDRRADCNLYGYARNNPLQYTDSTGKCSQPVGLSRGQVGFCIDAFISTPNVPGSPLPGLVEGLGDNRSFVANDPKATSRVQIQGILDFKQRSLVSVSVRPGLSEVRAPLGASMGIIVMGIRQEQGKALSSVSADFSEQGGAATLTVKFTGINGFHNYPLAPKGEILYQGSWDVRQDGTVTWGENDVRHSPYPSFGMYSYTFDHEGNVVATPLREFRETSIDSLSTLDAVEAPRTGN